MTLIPETREGKPQISVVVVNYNAGRHLMECVRSVLPQVGQIVLVDNASSDASIDLCFQHFADDPKLKLVRNKTNLGFAAACNIGITHAVGDFLLFLNPDCRLEPLSVYELVRVLESGSTIGMVGGLLLNSDGSEQAGGRRAIPTPWRSCVRVFGLHHFANLSPRLLFDFHLHKQPLPTQPVEVEAISGACMLVKRSAMEDVGPWDEGYFLHCEDLDWCMRFRQKGWKILFVPTASVTHELGVSSRSRPIFVEWHKHKGMMRFYRKFFRGQYPSILMGVVASGVWIRFTLVAMNHVVKRLIGRS